jgi:NADPH-dependent 2,4-dienoyl-CoA reductase/sulfur reductase-like enzyme
MDAVNLNFILRSRGDMTMYSYKEFVHDPHVDYYFKNISAVYYVNNSDGDTIFYNQRQFNKNEPMPKKLEITNKVSPKANRLVFFDGNIIHTGMSPNKHKNRIIINSNFKL